MLEVFEVRISAIVQVCIFVVVVNHVVVSEFTTAYDLSVLMVEVSHHIDVSFMENKESFT